MITETKPAWVEELRKKLAQPPTPAELERRREAVEEIDRLNRERPLPPGTFERLFDLADEEDRADGDDFEDRRQDGA